MRQFFNPIQEEEENEINITPMLDVVFIMLIFFIVTATFVKEAGIDVNRPDAATAVKKENANILIAISANNAVWIDKRMISCGTSKHRAPSCREPARVGGNSG